MSSASSEPAVILIIDDDPIVLTGIAAILNATGYACHCARDREAALAAVQGLAVDLIVCDVNLAGESGPELSCELRRQPGMDEVPVMFMSSAQTPDIVRRSHEAGAAYYLRKPFEPEVLLRMVAKALWMPHMISPRPSFAPPHSQSAGPAPKFSRIQQAIQGIKMPLA